MCTHILLLVLKYCNDVANVYDMFSFYEAKCTLSLHLINMAFINFIPLIFSLNSGINLSNFAGIRHLAMCSSA